MKFRKIHENSIRLSQEVGRPPQLEMKNEALNREPMEQPFARLLDLELPNHLNHIKSVVLSAQFQEKKSRSSKSRGPHIL
jgi:hypothetical protein